MAIREMIADVRTLPHGSIVCAANVLKAFGAQSWPDVQRILATA